MSWFDTVVDLAVAGVGAATGPIGTAVSSAWGASRKNEQAKAAAQKQMSFQENMSSTGYQRSMADMRAAGLNPILAYRQGGASSPGGSSYQPENVIGPAITTALAAKRLKADLKNIAADTKKKKAEEYTTRALGHKANVDREISKTQADILRWDEHSAKAAAIQSDAVYSLYKSSPGEALKYFELLRRTIGK